MRKSSAIQQAPVRMVYHCGEDLARIIPLAKICGLVILYCLVTTNRAPGGNGRNSQIRWQPACLKSLSLSRALHLPVSDSGKVTELESSDSLMP
jgi:hypothetical protein